MNQEQMHNKELFFVKRGPEWVFKTFFFLPVFGMFKLSHGFWTSNLLILNIFPLIQVAFSKNDDSVKPLG